MVALSNKLDSIITFLSCNYFELSTLLHLFAGFQICCIFVKNKLCAKITIDTLFPLVRQAAYLLCKMQKHPL